MGNFGRQDEDCRRLLLPAQLERLIFFTVGEKIHLKSVLKQISCCFQLVKYEEFILDKKLSNIFQDHLSQEKNTCTISTVSSEYK